MIALLITARMGSSRLPRKHLTPANGKPLLYWLIRRLEHAFADELAEKRVAIAVATSDKPGNEKFAEVTAGTSCSVLHGSDNNIPLRHLQCARALGATHVISVDGDDILCSMRAARTLFEQIVGQPDKDLYNITGLPLGMNLSAYSTAYLEKSLERHGQQKLETGWGRIFTDPRTLNTSLGNYDIKGDLRFTLDYPQDAEFFCRLIAELGEKVITAGDEEIIETVQKNGFYKLNASLQEEYFANYYSERDKETKEQGKG
jgi:spore coat polysaccharide biosynthesis protein SpsF